MDKETKTCEDLIPVDQGNDPEEKPSFIFLDWLKGERLDEEAQVGLALEYGHTIGVRRALSIENFGKENLWIEMELLPRHEYHGKHSGLYLATSRCECVWVNVRNILYAFDLE